MGEALFLGFLLAAAYLAAVVILLLILPGWKAKVGLLFAAIAVPYLTLQQSQAALEEKHAQAEAARKRERDEQGWNIAAYTSFCSQRNKRVLQTASLPSTSTASVGIRVVVRPDLPPIGLFWLEADFNPRVSACPRSSPSKLELQDRDPDGRGPILLLPRCGPRASAKQSLQVSYELSIGDDLHQESVPYPLRDSRMQSASVHLRSLKNGSLLASDTVYFLGDRSGQGGCHSAEDQIAELLWDVFGGARLSPAQPEQPVLGRGPSDLRDLRHQQR